MNVYKICWISNEFLFQMMLLQSKRLFHTLENYQNVVRKWKKSITYSGIHLDTKHDFHRMTGCSPGAFATGVACKQGTLTLPDTWSPPPFFWGGGGILMLQGLRLVFPNLPCLLSTFRLKYPSELSRSCLKRKEKKSGRSRMTNTINGRQCIGRMTQRLQIRSIIHLM